MQLNVRLAALAAAFSAMGMAASVPIGNPSFESPVQSPGGFQFGIVGGWTDVGDVITWYPNPAQFASVPDGHQVGSLGAGGGGGESISQILSATVEPDTVYTLSFYVGAATGYVYGGYTATLSANGVTLVSHTNNVTPSIGGFVQDTMVYNSGASPAELGQPLDISFFQGNGATEYDLVQLDATSTGTPEPATWVVLLCGLAVMGAIRRRASVQ